ncbi:MAG: DUF1508 domain-containing protein [Clostridia bacterium]|nr:DUF1508 domain-containing protein [Clostridia bacterium]
MDKLNAFFEGLAQKIPFAQQFFSKNIAIGPIEFNTLFLILAGLVLLIILIVIIACSTKSSKKKAKASDSSPLYAAEKPAPEQTDVTAPILETPSVAVTIQEPKTQPIAQPVITAKAEPVASPVITAKAEPVASPVTTAKAEPSPKVEPKEGSKAPAAKKAAKVPPPASDEPLRLFKSRERNAVQAEPITEKKVTTEKAQPLTEIIAEEALAANDEQKKTSGKFEIALKVDGYRYYLIANNGQLLFESTGYTSAGGALKGIDTFKKAVEGGNFVVDKDKFGRYRYILNRRYAGENYSTKTSCESSIESVKNFSNTAAVVPYVYDAEAEKKYADNKNTFVEVVDWDAVEKEDAAKKPSGKFEIAKRADGYHYYLIANNGQLLFSSNGYANASSAKDAIKNFKKAVYMDNFIVDEDKFGRFRFILRGASFSSVYVGESYNTKAACEKIINSVKNFSRTAIITPYSA